jgi:aspartate aminotransferase
MSISRAIAEQMEGTSWIRRMFEIGVRLRQERGPENVFDYTLGNPDVEPPAAVTEALRRVAAEERPLSHGYMPNAGFPDVRAAIARGLAERSGTSVTGEDVIMTVGAAGAINTVLKSILDSGDEAIVLKPYFPEYRFYIENHGGRVVEVDTGERFQPDVARIAAAMGPRTKAILLNSPNNPTGAVYPAETLRELNSIVREPAILISDEPYRTLTYDGVETPETLALIERWWRLAGRKPWRSPVNESGTWRFPRAWRKRRLCATPARSPTASWAMSTPRRSGSAWWLKHRMPWWTCASIRPSATCYRTP